MARQVAKPAGPGALPRFRRRRVRVLERCLACEADFKRVARDTSAMADKCEADRSTFA